MEPNGAAIRPTHMTNTTSILADLDEYTEDACNACGIPFDSSDDCKLLNGIPVCAACVTR